MSRESTIGKMNYYALYCNVKFGNAAALQHLCFLVIRRILNDLNALSSAYFTVKPIRFVYLSFNFTILVDYY